MKRHRTRWRKYQQRVDPSRLVFIDETWTKTNMTRLYGWAKRGSRLIDNVPQGHWKTSTFLAALRCDRVEAPCLIRAHVLARRLAMNPSSTLEEAGAHEGMGAPYAARLMRLDFLAPDIVVAILNGRQPVALTATKLMADTRLPLDWSEQRKALGFA